MARFNNNNADSMEDLFGEISVIENPMELSLPAAGPADASHAAQSLLQHSGKVMRSASRQSAALKNLGSSNTGPRVAIHTQSQLKSNPPPRYAKVSHSRSKNKKNRIDDYQWYDSVPVRAPWTAGHKIIKYSALGELKPTLRFDRDELLAYIDGCREQGIPLCMWVQNPPTTHCDRYMSNGSHLCRYVDCPVESRSIMRGMLQVSMDEHPTETSNGCLDPFSVAGCFHLFCLEEMILMPELMQIADVQPDVRDLPLEEKNPMSLNREERLLSAYNEWKEEHYNQYLRQGQAIPLSLRRRDRLIHFLMFMKVQNQPIARQRKREERAGNDITKHWGDLHKLAALKKASLSQSRAQKKAAMPATGRRRRGREYREEEEDDDDDDSIGVRSAKRTRAVAAPPSFLDGQSASWGIPQPFSAPGMYFPYGVQQPYLAGTPSAFYAYEYGQPLPLAPVAFPCFNAEVQGQEQVQEQEAAQVTAQVTAQEENIDCFIDPLLLQ